MGVFFLALRKMQENTAMGHVKKIILVSIHHMIDMIERNTSLFAMNIETANKTRTCWNYTKANIFLIALMHLNLQRT